MIVYCLTFKKASRLNKYKYFIRCSIFLNLKANDFYKERNQTHLIKSCLNIIRRIYSKCITFSRKSANRHKKKFFFLVSCLCICFPKRIHKSQKENFNANKFYLTLHIRNHFILKKRNLKPTLSIYINFNLSKIRKR